VEQRQAAAFHDGESSIEDRWAKYSLNASIRRQIIAKQRALNGAAANLTQERESKSAFTPSTSSRSLEDNLLRSTVEPLMSANFSGSLNEQLRNKYLHIEGISDNQPPTEIRRSLWLYNPDDASNSDSDRIIAQMFHVPENYRRLQDRKQSPAVKSIYVDGGFDDTPMGGTKFENDECPVAACRLTNSLTEADSADLRLFQSNAVFSFSRKPSGQIWAIFLLESPANTAQFNNAKDIINWTATYRWDSTIVTPYAKFMRYKNVQRPTRTKNGAGLRRQTSLIPDVAMSTKINYAKGKTKMVAWFVSNCYARNKRQEYVEELAK
jgi:hypothetical protein